jgi:hypothetical protein
VTISEEQFRFLNNRHIHDAVALAQETLHSIKKNNLKVTILKLDLAKAYDRVDWNFLRLALLKMGMTTKIVNSIMGCLDSATFAILINGSPSRFFKVMRGLKQGCPLSPFLFLIVVEALSQMIHEARAQQTLRGIKVSNS